MPERQFVKYTFLKVDPAWRRLDPTPSARATSARFIAACEDFAAERLLRAFSLVGTRGDADLMLLTPGDEPRAHPRVPRRARPERPDGAGARRRTRFLAMTKPSEYSDESRLEVRPAHAKYLFVYPFVKTREWYGLAPNERWRIMQEHIRGRPRVPEHRPQHELLVRARRPGVRRRVRERRARRSSSTSCSACARPSRPRYTKRDTPTFTCVAMSVERALNALDGEPLTVEVAA